MTSTSRATWATDLDFTPTPRDVCAIAEVLESRHGTLAAEIADFFAMYHGEKGPRGGLGLGMASQSLSATANGRASNVTDRRASAPMPPVSSNSRKHPSSSLAVLPPA